MDDALEVWHFYVPHGKEKWRIEIRLVRAFRRIGQKNLPWDALLSDHGVSGLDDNGSRDEIFDIGGSHSFCVDLT